MFHYDRGLKLTRADLAVDICRRQKRAFISHAHSDHMARHEYAICTPQTAALYQLRFGPRPTHALPYRSTIDWGGLKLTTFPAGHCLGSAMLLADDGEQTLLYTGDFKLGESATAERAELPHADVLVIESTYGRPEYRLTPRAKAIDQLITLVKRVINGGATPVIQAYALGKSQEVTKILTDADIPVLQHPVVYAVSEVYAACGVDLGNVRRYAGVPEPGHAVVTPPRFHKAGQLPGLKRTITFAVTGWAMHSGTKFRLGVDYAIPLSDHADYDELFRAVDMVSPRVVYCTHGPVSFVDCLRREGINAHPLSGTREGYAALRPCQMRLF